MWGGWKEAGGVRRTEQPRIGSSAEAPPSLPRAPPLLSVTLARRQRFPLLADDVGLDSGAPATQKARFGQNRVRGGACVKRKRSHRTPVYLMMREGGVRGRGEGGG